MDTEPNLSEEPKNKDKVLNVKLFSALREKQSPKDKLRKVTQYLKEGANPNSFDDTDNNNTPLHVAAIKGEAKIVKLLLDQGANVTLTNNNNLTVLDIIQFSKTPNGPEMCNIVFKKYGYVKRGGTSGVKGELYETKLLSLILLRALYDNNIKEFILGTNLDGIGALDDIVLRYKTNDTQKSKILFLQAKHKENETITVEDLLNPKKDINLQKYFQSYLKVKQKFATDNENTMFQGLMKNIDCKFIIYTSAKQYFTQNKNTKNKTLDEENQPEEKYLINAGKNGKIFKFKTNYDCNEFATIFTSSRPIILAQILSKFILKDDNSYKNIMLDDLMKTYHLFLAHKVIRIKTPTTTSDHCVWEFRKEFLTSVEENLRLIKEEICKELAVIRGLTADHQRCEVESIINSLTFKLPVDFGNSYFSFSGDEAKKQSRVNHMCSIFQRIFESTTSSYIRINDHSVGPDEIVQSKDLESHWLGGLVGNLLISDDKQTGLLKFNLNNDDTNLSNDCVKILQQLHKTYRNQLSLFRFDINYYKFPKLTLNSVCCKEYDLELVKDFFSKMRIYTNQAKEDEVETVLKYDIYKIFSNQEKQSNFLFRVKCDAIFLKVHDKVQKWWQQPHSAPYLTKTCKFYHQVEQELLDNPLLSIIHYMCIKKNKTQLKFENHAIPFNVLDTFLKGNERIMTILSDEITFSSVKVIQYLKETGKEEHFMFIDLGHEIIENCFESVLIELELSAIPLLLVLDRESNDINNDRSYMITESFKGKVILITCIEFEANIINCSLRHIYRDNSNNFSSLTSEIRKMVLEERQIVFQGILVPINYVLSETSMDLITPKLLENILNNERIAIGTVLTNNFYNKIVNYHVKRTISRFIILNKNLKNNSELHFIQDDNIDQITEDHKEIVLITKAKQVFDTISRKYTKSNIHWFLELNNSDQIVWKQSQGNIETIIKYVDNTSLEFAHTLQRLEARLKKLEFKPNTLKDIQNRIVIVSSEAAMGKSTLLTHLAINTKRQYPNLWVLNINLLDNNCINQFSYWKNNDICIDMIEVIKFIYRCINIKYKSDNILMEIAKLVNITITNEIFLSDDENKCLSEVDISEIKLFNYFYNNNNVALLIDGADELCPNYENEIIQLLLTLKTSKIAHLWITSRPHNILKKLETTLETFSFILHPFTLSEQIQFLKHACTQKLSLDKTINVEKCKAYIVSTVVEMHVSIVEVLEVKRNFTSIPLHLYMIVEICEDLLKFSLKLKQSELSNKYMLDFWGTINYHSFYEKFISKQFENQFDEKTDLINTNYPYILKIRKEAHQMFVDNLKILSAYSILDKDILSKDDIEIVKEFIENIKSGDEQTGIIKIVSGDDPKFLHFTFAEYFAAEFIFHKLRTARSTKLIWKYLIEHVLLADKNYGIRKFINSKLQKNNDIINELKSNKKRIQTTFQTLLAQFNNSPFTAIYIAIEDGFEYIAKFLIECAKPSLNKLNLLDVTNIIHMKCNKYCVYCAALLSPRQSFIKNLMSLINIDNERPENRLYCQKESYFCSDEQMCVTVNSYLQLVPQTINVIIEFLTKRAKGWLPIKTAHWPLGRHGFIIEYLLSLTKTQRCTIFNFHDNNEPEPSHSPVSNTPDSTFLTVMELDRKGFENKCVIANSFTVKSFISLLKSILNSNYENPDAFVENFIVNESHDSNTFEFSNIKTKIQSHISARPEGYLKKELYESKLRNLILLKAMCDDNVKLFTLSHERYMNVFNDIIFRYKTNETQRTRMIFLGEEYDIYKKIDLLECFQSYLGLRKNFVIDHENPVFHGPLKNIDYKFILYTAKKDILCKNLILKNVDEGDFVNISKNGNIYKLAYSNEDVETLISKFAESRVINLAKLMNISSFSDDIFVTGNIGELKTYYHFLAQNVIEIIDVNVPFDKDHDGSTSKKFCMGRFRPSFFVSNDKNLQLLKKEICKCIATRHTIRSDSQMDELEDIMKSHKFKLPVNFGNVSFSFIGDETEKQKMLDKLLSVFEKLCKTATSFESNYLLIEVDDDSVGPHEVVQINDLVGICSLEELVGNLLVNDEETDMLRINLDEKELSDDNIKLLKQLKEKYGGQLSQYRFDINVSNFPKLTMNAKKYERKLITDFLSKLEFYTSQPSEDEMEKMLKKDLNHCFNVQKKQNDFLFRLKCDAIILTYLWYNNKFANNCTYSTAAFNWTATNKNPVI